MRAVSPRKRPAVFLAASLLIFAPASRGQTGPPAPAAGAVHDEFRITPRDSAVSLTHEFVLPSSEVLLLDSARLTSPADYTIDYRRGKVTLRKAAWRSRAKADTLTLNVRYRAFPFSFQRSYTHRAPVIRTDSGAARPGAGPAPLAKSGFSFDDLFGSNLQKSGSIVRGFTVGSNRDLSLNSGFRMQMAGSLTRDLEVVAALTDENSPIQPEGTTRTLQEVDKVFVELRGSDVSATLGDFNLGLSGNEFGSVNRKLQGAEGTGALRAGATEGDVRLVGAVPRGKFQTNQLQGADGIQGPYRLSGANGERDILVIAGSERVYVNGERMTRGEINDYVVDYAAAEVTFTPRRFIASASRIVVDFEYTDRHFTRNFAAATSQAGFFNKRLTFGAEFLTENDNQDSPVDAALGDSDKAILRAAGNDPLKGVRPGAVVVGAGKGQYVRIDTLVATPAGSDTAISVYRFAPSDSLNAVYSVSFSFVGAGKGEYSIVSLGRYEFAGIGRGSYSPILFLPMPSAHRLADFTLGTRVTDELTLGGEYALSTYDPNRFSSIGDDESTGPAASFNAAYDTRHLSIGGSDLGSVGLKFKERFIDRRFVSPDRVNEIEFNRKWNIVDSTRRDEELREGSLTLGPSEALSLTGGLGWMKRGEEFLSRRYALSGVVSGNGIPIVRYDGELIKSQDAISDEGSTWYRHRALAEMAAGLFRPGIAYNGEDLLGSSLRTGVIEPTSFRFNEITPGVRLDSAGGQSFRASVSFRWEDSLSAGTVQRASRSLTQQYGWQMREWNSLTTSLDLTLRKKTPSDPFRRPGQPDLQDILLRSQSRFTPFQRGVESDVLYELATGQSSRPERVFQQVQKGMGNLTYIGDVNGNHIVDDQDFRPARFDGDYISVTVPGDNLIPTVDLKAGARVRLNGERLFGRGSWPGNVLGFLSSESYARVDERSTEPDEKQIYLLHFSHFLDDRTTIAGSALVSQDLYVMENRPEFSLRLRYSQRRGLTEYALAEERTFSNERSVRVRWQLVKEFSNQTDFAATKDILNSPGADYRIRSIESGDLATDWSYRPEQRVELGIRLTAGRAENYDTSRADINTQALRLIYSLNERGQGRAEFTREEVILSHARSGAVPFELTGGKVPGRSWLWHLGVDYRLTQFIQGAVSYDGRSEGGSSPVHTAKAEVRAFF
jgi:hypothetical protein